MRIWKAFHETASEGCILVWCASKRDAKQLLAMARKSSEPDEFEPSGFEPVDIPTKKQDLIRWLNIQFNRDNG